MKPFDLAQAQAGKPLCTRDGKQAKFVAFLPELGMECVVAVTDGTLAAHQCNGQYFEHRTDLRDLMMADPPPRRVKQWLNVYRGNNGLHSFGYHEPCKGDPEMIAQVEVEFEIPGDA